MRRWENKLQSWLQAGLITSDQRDRIVAHEDSLDRRNIAVYTIIGLGAIIIAIGIISLVAYNWDKTPASLKLVSNFTMLTATAVIAYRLYNSSKKIYFEILSAVFFLLIAGSIGLISQIFHTGGEFYQAATFWAVITIPLIAMSRGTVTINLWLAVFIIALQGQLYHALQHGYFRDILFSVTILFALLPVIFGAAAVVLQRMRRDNLVAMGRALAVWALAGALVGTIYLSVPIRYDQDYALGALIALVLLVNGAVIAGIVFLTIKSLGRAAILLAAGAMLYGIMTAVNISWHEWQVRQFPDAMLFILIWFAAAFLFYSLEYRKLFNVMIAGIGIRFLVVYFQIFKDLAVTGFGLIVSGLVIIGACLLYIKKRESLYGLMDRLK